MDVSVSHVAMNTDQLSKSAVSRRGVAIVMGTILFSSLGISQGVVRAETFGPCWCRTIVPDLIGGRVNSQKSEVDIRLNPEGYTIPESGCPQYSLWGTMEDGTPRSAMQVDGGPFLGENCGGSTLEPRSCRIPPSLQDGPHTVVTRCIAEGPNGVEEFTHSFSFIVDATAPTLSITGRIPDSVQPIIGFHAEGTSDGSSLEISLVSTIFGKGGIYRTVSISGGQWSVDFTPEELTPLIDSLGPPTTVHLNLTANDGINATTKSVDFMLDGVGPRIVIATPSGVEEFNNLATITGTARDVSGVGRLTIEIQDVTTGNYWSSSSRKFDSKQPVQMELASNTGDPDRDILWIYSLLTARYLQSFHIYSITLTAEDSFHNKSSVTTTEMFTRGLLSFGTYPIGFGGAGSATFFPPNETVVWGGWEEKSVCVSFSDQIRSQTQWKDKVYVRNDDDALLPSATKSSFGAGICNGDADKLEVKVRSQPYSCVRQGTVRIYFEQTIIGETTIAIIAPHRTFATLLPRESNIGAGPNPIAECTSVKAKSPCRIDRWRFSFDAGPFQSGLDSRVVGLRFLENEGRATPLIVNGVRVPMCPAKPVVQDRYAPLQAMVDDVGFSDGLPPWSCGSASVQGIRLFSGYILNQLAACEFVKGISKTVHMKENQRLTTTRSDDH